MINGGDWNANLSLGKSAVIGVNVCDLLFLHTRQYWSETCEKSGAASRLHIVVELEISENHFIDCDLTHVNFQASLGQPDAYHPRYHPVDLNRPPGPMKGVMFRMRLLLAIDFVLVRFLNSSANDSLRISKSNFASATFNSTESVILRHVNGNDSAFVGYAVDKQLCELTFGRYFTLSIQTSAVFLAC